MATIVLGEGGVAFLTHSMNLSDFMRYILSTLRLNDTHPISGQSDHRRGHISPQLRINKAGRLAGRGLEVMGISNLQIGRMVPSGPGVEWPPPLGNETELDVDFCLTWSFDPRYEFGLKSPIVLFPQNNPFAS